MEIESSSEIEVTASVSIQPLPNDGDSTVSNDLSANTDVEFQAFMRAMDEHASAVISSPERYRPIRKPSPVNKQLNKEAELDFQKSTVAAQKKFQLKSKTKLNIKIKNVKLTAKWRWLDKDDTCGICRSPYESCCS
uniref:Anaphase-promoting complex subunit 11 RING-H2 finger domain-containing protein n=1 Tax=Panagrolaimus sp. JU765 TaxID=591449 RepID=A0AC34R7S0_9BILA